jgi:glucose/arabinose dehydrogenase
MVRQGRFLQTGIIGLVACAFVPASRGGTPPTTIRIANGLNKPLFVTHAPGDFQRIFIVEQTGRIKIRKNGVVLSAPFLNVDDLSSSTNERGLLGLAFHPNYPENGFFYINYIDNLGDTVIARYAVSDNPDVADTNAELVVRIDRVPTVTTHYGGWMGFGPDGNLYVASGDGGGPTQTSVNAQDITDNLLGKILRIDVDHDDFPNDANRNYAIPPDNPFVGGGGDGDDEIWSYGLRNPWRCAFDADTGDLYIADVGHSDWEEINFQNAGSPGGQNYGWRCMEGNHCTGLTGCVCFSPSLTLPIHEYGHTGSPSGCSITGGEVYRGCAIPELLGTYFYADFCTSEIWSFRYNGAVSELQERTTDFAPPDNLSLHSISSFGKDAAGELYICDLGGGEVFKIIPGTPIAITSSDPPAGAIDARRPFDPADGVPVGWQETLLTWGGSVSCLTPLDFTLTQEGGINAVPFVTDVQLTDADEVRLLLSHPIAVLAWTTIHHPPSGTSVRIGFLPADVDGDAASGLADLAALIDALNGAGPARPIWSTDINRSSTTTPADVLEEIDLLNGTGKYDPFDGAVLP